MRRRMIPDIKSLEKPEVNEAVEKPVEDQSIFFGGWIFWGFFILIIFFIFGKGFFWRY